MFQPIQLGALKLSHRIVMAPLTRVRGTDTFAPCETAVEYYAQRATPGGLLITEATVISPETPYEYAPGIYTKEQELGWKKIVDAVHAKGGLICLQLWHIGRAAHASWGNNPFLKGLNRPLPTVSASNKPLPSKMLGTEYGTNKKVPPSTPRPLTAEEIRTRLVQDYRQAAEAAKRAGFDAVEVHSAHGYLLDQFLCDSTNDRTDEYGGSIENRSRALHQVLAGVIEVFGADRVGVRISPTYKDSLTYYDTRDSNPELLYREVIKSLDRYKLAYLLLTEPRWSGGKVNFDPRTDTMVNLPLRNAWAKEVYSGNIIGAGGFTPSSARECLEKGIYDVIAFGRWFISNPDLVERLKTGAKLNIYERTTFYLRDPVKGFIDYPFLGQENNPKFAKYPTIEQKDIGVTLEQKAKL